MTAYDLIVRGGNVVGVGLPAGDPARADVAVADGRIVAVGFDLEGSAREKIDATGLHVLPGAIDAHVHFNEPGRTDWEGFAAGRRALAAGGATAYTEMPLNAHPPTLDAPSFDFKLAAAKASSLAGFALWGGLVPGNVDRLEELAERGVLSFKAFMSNSGIDDFEAADDLTLHEGMRRSAELDLPVLVHAESDQIAGGLARRAMAEGRNRVSDYLASHPVVAELEAIERAILLAEDRTWGDGVSWRSDRLGAGWATHKAQPSGGHDAGRGCDAGGTTAAGVRDVQQWGNRIRTEKRSASS